VSPPIDLDNDGWLKAAIGSLWFCGVTYVLIGLLFPLIFLAGPGASEGEGLIMFACLLPVGVACAVGNFVVARALSQRKKWGWIGGIVVGAIYAPSGCLIFGGIILYALLRPGFKDAYEKAAEGGATTF